VQRSDLVEEAVEDARSYIVSERGDLILSTGDDEVARFAPGTWIAVERVGVALREVWPPDDFDYLMANLGERLVVGYGLDFRYPLEPFLSPFFNDFNAFVDAVAEREGGDPGLDSEHRRWIASSVAAVFGINE
jgi:hypothetical protein